MIFAPPLGMPVSPLSRHHQLFWVGKGVGLMKQLTPLSPDLLSGGAALREPQATVVLNDFTPRPLLPLHDHKFSSRDGKFLMRRHRGRFPCSHGIGIRATSESGSLGCSWLETDGLQVVVRARLGQIEWRFPNTRPMEKE